MRVPRLRELRDFYAWSQEDLAHRAGVGRGTVARGERGEQLRPSSVRKLARALNVRPSALTRLPEQ